MTRNQAAWLNQQRGELCIGAAPDPTPSPDEVVIRSEALAIQPLDSSILALAYVPRNYPTILGNNVAGTVVSVGSAVTKFAPGDRVISDTPAYTTNDNKYGGWQRLVTSKALTTCHIPPGKALEEAIAMPFALLTAVGALCYTLGMEKPPNCGEGNVLIWGASGSVGGYAVQYARSVGYCVYATASPSKFDYVRSLGALKVFDYRDSKVIDHLKAVGSFRYIMSATADPKAVNAIGEIMQPNGGEFVHVRPRSEEMILPNNVKMIYNSFSLLTQRPENAQLTEWWYETYLPMAMAGGIISTPVEKRKGGFKAIKQACEDVRTGVSSGKLVVNLQES